MASNDVLDQVGLKRFYPEVSTGNIVRLRAVSAPNTAPAVTGFLGLPFPKATGSTGYQFIHRVPANGAPLAVGLNFELILTDDPNAGGPGLNAYFGITVKVLTSGAVDWSQTGAGTEQLLAITMPTPSLRPTIASFPVLAAQLNGAVAGSVILVRLRRLGSNVLDTHPGQILITGLTVLAS